MASDLEWSYDMLDKTSRSFAMVIRALDPELRDAVCIFYLALRALDTVEDDTAFDVQKKLPLLRSFHDKIVDPNWNMDGCGYGDEKVLLQQLHRMNRCLLALKPGYQRVIKDITRRMGEGMADFIEKEVVTVKDWDLYCHYVAGLVGIGLSGIFAECGKEDPNFKNWNDLSNSMGLFLQKTNIIRDYLEDINEKRIFWPREIWSLYAKNLADFKEQKNAQQALFCLNHLITNAFQHIPDGIDYMSRVKDQNNFNFCAIPQVMAIATLSECYNNHGVFTGVVKIPREETVKIMENLSDIYSVCRMFLHYIEKTEKKVPLNDPNRAQMLAHLKKSKEVIQKKLKERKQKVPSSKL